MTLTPEQISSYLHMTAMGNIANGQPNGQYTLGNQDAAVHWHPAEDEQAYRYTTEHGGITLQQWYYPTQLDAAADIGNGNWTGIRLFDGGGNWLGTPNNPTKATEPAPVTAVVAAAAAPLPAPIAEQAPKPAAAVVEPKPALIAAAAVLPPAAAPAAVIVHVHLDAPAASVAPAPGEIHVHVLPPAPVAAPDPVVQPAAPAPKRGFWAWLRHLFHRKA